MLAGKALTRPDGCTGSVELSMLADVITKSHVLAHMSHSSSITFER